MDNRETFNLTDSLFETPSEARGPYDLKNLEGQKPIEVYLV
jgi:hypothetical protein